VKDDEDRENRRRSVWLPATLLFLMLSLDGAAVYWLTLPQTGVGEDQASPKQAAPENAEAVKQPANSAPVPVEPGKSAQTEPKEAAALAAKAGNEKAPDPPPNPLQETDKNGDKPPSDVTEMVAKKNLAAPTTPPAEKPAPRATADVPPAAVPAPPPAVPTPPTAEPENPERDTAIAPSVGQILPKLPPAPPSAPLPQAPDPALVENSLKGPLPIVGRDGREAWRVYARPFDQLDQRPRISVVLYGLGISAAATRTAIQGLPGAITLAFSPYADGLGNWIANARAAGHEILLMVPMEPRNYPDYDPGPQALLTSLTESENAERLEWILGRGVGYVGITDFMGSHFTNSTQHMRVLFRDLKKRGLMYLESRFSSRAISGEIAAASKVPFASSTLYIDSQASRPAIDGQLAEAERLAQKLGAVVIMGFLYPVTLERVAKWAVTVEKRGFALAPVSAIAKRQD